MKKLRLLTLGIVVLVQACAVGPTYTPLTKEKRDSISTVQLYNLVIQDEVKPAIAMSNVTGAMGGGLIPALIDSSINKKRSNTAQDIIKPLYDATGDLDYRELLADSVNAHLTKEFTFEELKARAEAVLLSNQELKKRIASLEENEGLLYLSSFYRFVDDSKALNTSTIAFLYTKQPEKKASKSKRVPKPTYYNVFNYQSAEAGNGGESSMALWSADDGALFRQELIRSVDETAKGLVYDMQPVLDEACLKVVKVSFASAINSKLTVQGRLISSEDGRSLIRDDGGALYSTAGTPVYIKNTSKSKNKNRQCQQGEQV